MMSRSGGGVFRGIAAIPGFDASTPRPIAIVTGAGSGIGAAVAARLAQRGYRLLLIGRRLDILHQRASELEAGPATARAGDESPRHFVASIDLADTGGIESAVEAALLPHGQPEVLVNSAGAGLYRPFLDCSSDEGRRLMQVNYFAAAELIRIILPRMLAQRRGHIINIASIASKVGPWGHSAYAPSKAALVSLTQTLACEYSGRGVRFSYVNPGIVDTAYFAHPDFAQLWSRVRDRAIAPDAAAKRIVRLLDRPQLELCVPRHYRLLDWIAAMHPGLAQRLVARQSRPGAAMATPSEIDPASRGLIDPSIQPAPTQI